MNLGKVPIAMAQLRAELDLSLVAPGWVSAMINTLGVTTALFFGMLGDRGDARADPRVAGSCVATYPMYL